MCAGDHAAMCSGIATVDRCQQYAFALGSNLFSGRHDRTQLRKPSRRPTGSNGSQGGWVCQSHGNKRAL